MRFQIWAIALLRLGSSDLLMDLAEGLLVRRTNDRRQWEDVLSHVTLHHQADIHLVKQDQVLPAFAIRLHSFVLIDCPAQHVAMKAVNERDSPVLALCSRRA